MKNFLILIGFCLILFSCKKENSNNQIDTQEIELSKVASEGDAQSEQSYSQIFDDVMGASDEVGVYGTGVFGRRSEERRVGKEC